MRSYTNHFRLFYVTAKKRLRMEHMKLETRDESSPLFPLSSSPSPAVSKIESLPTPLEGILS